MIAESANDKNITFLFDWTEQCKYCEQSNQCLYKKKFYEYCTFMKNISNYFLQSKGTDFELSIATRTSGVKVNCDWFKFSEDEYRKWWPKRQQFQGTTPVEDNNCTAK